MDIQIIILAAGYGKRMNNGELPKVLTPLKGKALIQWLLEAVKKSGVCEKPVVVVGQKAEMVKQTLGNNYTYVFQSEQLGTGHAVAVTKETLQGKAENIMVLYGDHPSVTPEMIISLAVAHAQSKTVITMATVTVEDFKEWRNSFFDYGRIIRNSKGDMEQIIERKDATDEQREIKEVNPGYYCFKADWLWNHLDKLKNNNVQQEYYLTDLVELACKEGEKISTVSVDPKTALGVNTQEQLALINEIL